MAYLNINIMDSGLAWLVTNGTRLDICSADVGSTYANVATYTLGNKTSLTIGSPAAGTSNGRKVTVPAITDGTVTGTNTAAYWAITNGSNVLAASGQLSSSQAVTSGNIFTLAAFDIGIPGPA